MLSVTIIIIALTVIASWYAWQNSNLMENWVHHPQSVARGEWWRLLTSGFLHADFMHLFFNMFVLYSFGSMVESVLVRELGLELGIASYIGLYLLAIVLSDIPTFFKHKNEFSYYSLGASGGVSGIVFASIYFNPLSELWIFPIPIAIKGYIFGALYLLYSHYMGKRGKDGINHSAHFYGAAVGFIGSILLIPDHLTTFFMLIKEQF